MLQNSMLFIGLLIICFGAVLVSKKLFGKAGLFAWIVIATAVSNITAASIGNGMLGIPLAATLANIPFATIFLANQILTACYGVKEGKKGVYICLFSSILFTGVMTLCSYLIPSATDPSTMLETANGANYTITQCIAALFNFDSFVMCNTIASILMLFLANFLDVILFDKLNKKCAEKHLGFVSFTAATVSNCLENFGFVLLGLFVFPLIVNLDPVPMLGVDGCLATAGTTCIFEIIIGFLNIPSIYLAKKWKMKNDRCEGCIE